MQNFLDFSKIKQLITGSGLTFTMILYTPPTLLFSNTKEMQFMLTLGWLTLTGRAWSQLMDPNHSVSR